MPTPDLPDASALVASLLSLMTRFSCLGCPQQALLQSYPDSQIPPLLKGVAQRLQGEWMQLHFAIADDPAANHPALH